MKQNRFDWFLLLIFLVNLILGAIAGNYTAALGWGCAFLTLIRIISNDIQEHE